MPSLAVFTLVLCKCVCGTTESMSLQADFEAAAASVKTFVPGAGKSVPDADKLVAYGLYKQATVGDVNIERSVVRCGAMRCGVASPF